MHAAFRLLAVAAALVLGLPAHAAEGVSPAEAVAQQRDHVAMLVDVRTPAEWAETGIPAGAQTISWGRPDFVANILALVQGNRDAPLVLICRTGKRSGKAVAALRDNGFTQVTHVAEGMAGSSAGPGWIARGLPLRPWQGAN